jgi:peptide deformylase
LATFPETKREPVPFHVIINPLLTLRGAAVEFFEGCLSVDGYQAIVPRSEEVTVQALDHRGQPVTIDASGWYARILQHEIDHLNGTLYIDRMRRRTFSTSRNVATLWRDQPPTDVVDKVGHDHEGDAPED